MAEKYMGTTDNEMRLWMLNFAGGISADPGKYSMSAGDAATVQTAVDAYNVAYGVANTETTRTAAAVNLKDVNRNSADGVCRLFAGLIKRNAGISDDDKIVIGVPPINNSREQRTCPQSGVTLSITAATQGAHTLNYINALDPTKRAKPVGATEVELFVAIAAGPVGSVDDAKYYRKFTRNPMAVFFGPEDKGKTATYFARWAGRRGDCGPFSPGVSMPIAA